MPATTPGQPAEPQQQAGQPPQDAGPPPQRSFRRVFGGDETGVGQDRLSADFAVTQTYDDNLLAGRTTTADPRVGQGGTYPAGRANLSYERHRGLATLTASGNSTVQYFDSLDGRLDHNHSAVLGFNLPIGRRLTMRVSQSAAYSTYYTLLGLPGAVQPAALEVPSVLPPQPVSGSAVSSEAGTELHSFGSFERQIGRRGSLIGNYGFGMTRFPTRNTRVQDAGLSYQHGIGQRLTLRSGYGVQTAMGGREQSDVILHNIDIGVDYSRTLPGLRNTSFSLSSGSTVMQLPRGYQYGLRGGASLVHLMGRSWTASLTYDRGAEIVGVLGDVLQSDSLLASLGGFVSERIELSFSGAYSKGHLGLREQAETLTYNGSAQMTYGLSRHFALNTAYQHYTYDFAEAALLPVGLPYAESRKSVSVGLLVLLPMPR